MPQQREFERDRFVQAFVPRAQCFPWTPKLDGIIGDPPGVTRWEDQRIFGFQDFMEGFIRRYDSPDRSLITKKTNLEFILQEYGPMMTTGQLCAVLKKSAFFSLEGFITSEGHQRIAMNACRDAAFRFCPIAQNDPKIRGKMLRASFIHICDLADPVLRSASEEIAKAYPLTLPWFTSIAVSSLVRYRHEADRCLDIGQLSTKAVAAMARHWVTHPEEVYDYIAGTAPPLHTGVSDRIVRNGLRHLRLVIRDPALSPELTSMERREMQREFGELLGSRDLLGAEIRSWCNKLAVLSMCGAGDSTSRQGLPLVDADDKKGKGIVYTTGMARACFERGASANAAKAQGGALAPRRGDTILRKLHDARREDLCVTVIPLIAKFVLTPAPTRFAPRWPTEALNT
jgi:hypothetical protein